MRAWLTHVLDDALDRDHLKALLEERALGADILDLRTVATVRDDLERAEARKLQPHYVRGFFLEAFRRLGGTVKEREPSRYELTKVPGRIRERARQAAYRPAVLPAYERVALRRSLSRSRVVRLPSSSVRVIRCSKRQSTWSCRTTETCFGEARFSSTPRTPPTSWLRWPI